MYWFQVQILHLVCSSGVSLANSYNLSLLCLLGAGSFPLNANNEIIGNNFEDVTSYLQNDRTQADSRFCLYGSLFWFSECSASAISRAPSSDLRLSAYNTAERKSGILVECCDCVAVPSKFFERYSRQNSGRSSAIRQRMQGPFHWQSENGSGTFLPSAFLDV